MESEVAERVGPRVKHRADRQACRGGHEPGWPVIGGRKVRSERPHVLGRAGRSRLESYALAQQEDSPNEAELARPAARGGDGVVCGHAGGRGPTGDLRHLHPECSLTPHPQGGFVYVFSQRTVKDCRQRQRVYLRPDKGIRLAMRVRKVIERVFAEAKKRHHLGHPRYQGRLGAALQTVMAFRGWLNRKRMAAWSGVDQGWHGA